MRQCFSVRRTPGPAAKPEGRVGSIMSDLDYLQLEGAVECAVRRGSHHQRVARCGAEKVDAPPTLAVLASKPRIECQLQ